MNEAIVQALLQGLKVFIVAGLTAFGADAANIVQVGTAGDPLTGPLVLSIVVAVVTAILKAIGGPTTPAPVAAGGVHPRGAGVAEHRRPSFLAI